MKLRSVFAYIFVFGLSISATASNGFAFATPLTTVRVTTGLTKPLFVTAPPGDTSRIFVIEQFSGTIGRIRIVTIPSNTLLATPFLSISGVSTSNEQGLLGLAFDPNYATNGYFYVNYTTSGGGAAGHTVIARYTVSGDPNVADAGSAVILKTINQPETNHNGGCLQFGPDGMLYDSQGDGGGAGDVHGSIGNAQSLTTLLGKMLRLDVNNPPTYIPADNPSIYGSAVDEKWAIGLRNPWRFSFDRQNGDLYIGDVGQDAVEEIDYVPAGTGAARNYGWRCREGNDTYNCTAGTHCACPSDPGLTAPIYTYTHATGICVTGGYVYRGAKIPDLKGIYFFADYSAATIWSLRASGGSYTEFTNRTAELAPGGGLSISQITSFGEDAAGEIYICDRGTGTGGEVFKIVVNCAGASESITTQPLSQNATAGQVVNFTVKTTGSLGLITYAWTKNGNPIGGDSSTLQLASVTCHDNGTYVCTITDQCGAALVSNPATLSVTPLPAGDIEGDCDCDFADLDAFVNVLLDLDTDPGRVSRSDVNGDTNVDGKDIQAIVDLLPNWPC